MKLFNIWKKNKSGKEDAGINSFEHEQTLQSFYDEHSQEGSKNKEDLSGFFPASEEENKNSIQMVLAQLNKNADGFSTNRQIDTEMDKITIKTYRTEELEAAIQSQTELLKEVTEYIEEAKKEYAALTANFSDIQLIEEAPISIKNNILSIAEKITTLAVDRKISRTAENKLSNPVYNKMESLEPDMPQALIQLQSYETNFQSVKSDIKILEGEKAALRYDARDLVKKQSKIKKYALLSGLGLIIVFGLFITASFVFEDGENYRFVAVTALAALLSIGILAYLKKTEREVMLTEIKLNKTVGLLNSTKIKYVNSANVLDYQYTKYGVKSSYELSGLYETYLQMKKQKQRISRITDELGESEHRLELLLRGLNLNDPYAWLSQIKAISDQKEMTAVKHELTERRQKLRTQIEYNMRRFDEIKKELRKIAYQCPQYADIVEERIQHFSR